MPGGGKRGKPKNGFPLFPPLLEIAGKARFPHFHRADSSISQRLKTERSTLVPACFPSVQAHPSMRKCYRAAFPNRGTAEKNFIAEKTERGGGRGKDLTLG